MAMVLNFIGVSATSVGFQLTWIKPGLS